MIQGLKTFALLLALFFLILGMAYLFSSERRSIREMKSRELIYRKEMGAFKSGLNHTYNKIPAYKRINKAL